MRSWKLGCFSSSQHSLVIADLQHVQKLAWSVSVRTGVEVTIFLGIQSLDEVEVKIVMFLCGRQEFLG